MIKQHNDLILVRAIFTLISKMLFVTHMTERKSFSYLFLFSVFLLDI